MKKVSIALLGCGTVGKGVIDLLAMNGPLIEEQLDTEITIKRRWNCPAIFCLRRTLPISSTMTK